MLINSIMNENVLKIVTISIVEIYHTEYKILSLLINKTVFSYLGSLKYSAYLLFFFLDLPIFLDNTSYKV